jgi:hypothetical protein
METSRLPSPLVRRASCVVRRASCVVRRASCVVRRASCVVRSCALSLDRRREKKGAERPKNKKQKNKPESLLWRLRGLLSFGLSRPRERHPAAPCGLKRIVNSLAQKREKQKHTRKQPALESERGRGRREKKEGDGSGVGVVRCMRACVRAQHVVSCALGPCVIVEKSLVSCGLVRRLGAAGLGREKSAGDRPSLVVAPRALAPLNTHTRRPKSNQNAALVSNTKSSISISINAG